MKPIEVAYTKTKRPKFTLTVDRDVRIKLNITHEEIALVKIGEQLRNAMASYDFLYTLRGLLKTNYISLSNNHESFKFYFKTNTVENTTIEVEDQKQLLYLKTFLGEQCIQDSFKSSSVALFERSLASTGSQSQAFVITQVFISKLNRLVTISNYSSDMDVIYDYWAIYGFYHAPYGINMTKYFTKEHLTLLRDKITDMRRNTPEDLTVEYIRQYIKEINNYGNNN